MASRAEIEAAAVSSHACPRCHREAGRKCISADQRRAVMKHPHPERLLWSARGEVNI